MPALYVIIYIEKVVNTMTKYEQYRKILEVLNEYNDLTSEELAEEIVNAINEED